MSHFKDPDSVSEKDKKGEAKSKKGKSHPDLYGPGTPSPVPAEEVEGTAATESAAQEQEPTDLNNLKQLLGEKEEELRQKQDALLRALADFENYKKRMEREKANLLKFGNETLMKELLPVIDDLDRALDHGRASKNVDTIIAGVELIKKEFLDRLARFGLKVMSSQGEVFDPNKHEAVSQIETSEHPENTIVEEFQKGYFIHDRLLRAPKVLVAKLPAPVPDKTDD